MDQPTDIAALSEDEDEGFHRSPISPEPSKFVQFVMRYSGGLIKNEAQAQYVLLAFAIIVFLLSFILLINSVGESHAAKIVAPRGMQVYNPGNAPPRLVPAP